MFRQCMSLFAKFVFVIFELCWAIIFFFVFFPVAFVNRIFYELCPKRKGTVSHVLIGRNEVAGNIRSLCRLLHRYKIPVKIAFDAYSKTHIFYGENSDSSRNSCYLNELYSAVCNRIANVYDLFIGILMSSHFYFIWKKSYLPFNLDYPLIRLSGAKLIIQHCGDDVRCRHLHDALFNHYCPGIESGPYVTDGLTDTLAKITRQYWAELFGLVVSSRNQATFQRGPVYPFFFSQEVICTSVKQPNTVPVLVHAPSDRSIKRTDIVLAAVKLLQQEGHIFDFKLLENMKNHVVIETLRNADIVIDQPATWPARFAVEGCAAGCCVISGNHFEFIGRQSSPVLQFEPDVASLVDVLRRLLKDKDQLSQRMKDCWYFWRDHYSPQATWALIDKVMNGSAEVVFPLRNQKQLILTNCNSLIERLLIQLLYHPQKQAPSGL